MFSQFYPQTLRRLQIIPSIRLIVTYTINKWPLNDLIQQKKRKEKKVVAHPCWYLNPRHYDLNMTNKSSISF